MAYALRTFKGTLVRFFRERGYGYVKVDHMPRDAHLHLRDCEFGAHEIRVGSRLEFYLADGPKGLDAIRVSICDEQERPSP